MAVIIGMKGSCAMPAVETGEGKARPKGDMFNMKKIGIFCLQLRRKLYYIPIDQGNRTNNRRKKGKIYSISKW